MEYTNLGRTGLKCQPALPRHDELRPETTTRRTASQIMDRALEPGINFFDTANVYGWKQGEGVTEQIIGRWFAQGGGRREQIVLATKVYGTMGDWPERRRPLGAAHPPRLRGQSCGGCRPTTSTSTRCTTSTATRRGTRSGRRWSMLVAAGQGALRRQHATSPAGTSRRPTRRRAARHFLGLVSRAEPLQPARAHDRARGAPGLRRTTASGVIPWSPLDGGLLGGVLADATDRRAAASARPCRRTSRPTATQLEACEKLCARARRAAGRRRARLAAAPTRR